MEINHKKPIEELVKSQRVFVFMKGEGDAPACRFSAQVVEILDKLKVKFGSFNILNDEAMRQAIKDYSNWPTIPQVFVDGKFIGGADIINELDESGELATLLKN